MSTNEQEEINRNPLDVGDETFIEYDGNVFHIEFPDDDRFHEVQSSTAEKIAKYILFALRTFTQNSLYDEMIEVLKFYHECSYDDGGHRAGVILRKVAERKLDIACSALGRYQLGSEPDIANEALSKMQEIFVETKSCLEEDVS